MINSVMSFQPLQSIVAQFDCKSEEKLFKYGCKVENNENNQ